MATLRDRLSQSIKQAQLGRDDIAVSTVRLILAALKERDIAERSKGNPDGVADDGIFSLLRSMIAQRRESIRLYEGDGRKDLAAQEAREIEVIERFLPPQMSEAEIAAEVGSAIAEVGAGSLRDVGRVVALLKERHDGRMDFTKASAMVRERLA
jgi:uncharacterized protein YqeY